ncbi:MAG: FAD-dependent oxidoreductase [Verrucomicrobia bacterium]|nr:FAD-dependent oxidoreductase [Verrucomicrobiota bacterium]
MKTIVIGAGIAGASAAFHLTELGVDVDIVDSEAPGRATYAGAGIICPWLSKNFDPQYQTLSFAAFRYYESLVSRLKALGQTGIQYDLVGGLAVAESRDQLGPIVQRLESHLDDGVKEVGQIRVLDRGGPRELFPYLDSRLAGVYLSGATRLSGESVRTALLAAATKAGARKLSGTAVLERSGDSAVGIRLNGDPLRADSIIVAGGSWSADLCRPLGIELDLEPQRGQIIHLKVEETSTGSWPVIVPVLNDYYLLAFPDSRIVVGATRESGSGFDARVTAGGVEEVLREGLALAPDLAKATLVEVRVGLRPMTKDGLPLIGRPAQIQGLIIATGMGRYGLTIGPYAGRLAADLAAGRATEIDLTPYKPDRQVR